MKETIFRYLCLILFFSFAFIINGLDERLKKSIDNLDINEFKKITNELKISQEDIKDSLKIIDTGIEKNQNQINKGNNRIMLGIFGCFLGSAIIDYNLGKYDEVIKKPYLNFTAFVKILSTPILNSIITIKNLSSKANAHEYYDYYPVMRYINGVALGTGIFACGSLSTLIKFYDGYKLKSKIKKYQELKKIILEEVY